jgi:hypothetical protein
MEQLQLQVDGGNGGVRSALSRVAQFFGARKRSLVVWYV